MTQQKNDTSDREKVAERIWVSVDEERSRVTPTRPRYEGVYTEYVRADLTPDPAMERDHRAMEKLRALPTDEYEGWCFENGSWWGMGDGMVLYQDDPLSVAGIHADPADAVLGTEADDEA